jgi:hypothetical protein
MEKGQLGNQAQQRIIFVWEGTVARLPDHRIVRQLEWLDHHTGAYDRAVKRWDLNQMAFKWMWSLLATTNLRIDLVVTTRPPAFAEAVSRLALDNNWPVRYVFQSSAEDLGRQLPIMADVVRVYYGLESQRWAFGPQGFHLTGRDQHP